MSSCRSSGIFQSFLQVLWLGGGLKLFGTRLKIPPLASVSHQRLWVLRPQLWKSYTDMLNIACCQFSQRNQGSFIGICKPLQQTSPRCGPGKLWSNWLCQGHGKPGCGCDCSCHHPENRQDICCEVHCWVSDVSPPVLCPATCYPPSQSCWRWTLSIWSAACLPPIPFS